MPDLEYWHLNGISTCLLRDTVPFMIMSDGISWTLLEYVREDLLPNRRNFGVGVGGCFSFHQCL